MPAPPAPVGYTDVPSSVASGPPPAPAGYSDIDAGFGSTLGHDVMNMVPNFLHVIRHPVDTGGQLAAAQAHQADLARQTTGIKSVWHSVASALPGVGPQLDQVFDEYGRGLPGQATAHALEFAAPFLIDPAWSAGRAVSEIPAVQTAGAVAKGAVKGAYDEFSRHSPMAMTGAGLGAFVGGTKGAEVGGTIGASIPAVVGGIRGGKSALAAARAARDVPEVVPPVSAPVPPVAPEPLTPPTVAPTALPEAPVAGNGTSSSTSTGPTLEPGQMPVAAHSTVKSVDQAVANKVHNISQYARKQQITGEQLSAMSPDELQSFLNDAHAHGKAQGNAVPKTKYNGLSDDTMKLILNRLKPGQ